MADRVGPCTRCATAYRSVCVVLRFDGSVRIWLCTEPTDMRKSFNGLSSLVKHRLESDPLNGQLYVFVNRRKTQMKILYFDCSGYAIWSKRLEQGQFVVRHSSADIKQSISFAQLQCLLEGIEVNDAKHYKRFKLRKS